MSKKALIIIDIQNDYFEGGAIELVNPVEASLNARKVLNYFRENNLPIAHIQHVSANPEVMPIFVEGTKGFDIHENVKPLDGEKVFRKYFPNSFRGTGLLEYLKEKKMNLSPAGIPGQTGLCITQKSQDATGLLLLKLNIKLTYQTIESFIS